MTIDEAIKDIQENIKPIVGGKSLDMALEALQKGKEIVDKVDRPLIIDKAIKTVEETDFNARLNLKQRRSIVCLLDFAKWYKQEALQLKWYREQDLIRREDVPTMEIYRLINTNRFEQLNEVLNNIPKAEYRGDENDD